ncbi:MAG: DEAD/DEAH box helicase [Chloroflexi bacterium]|nr:DEAD/DEAH box helicase [Chloroflexota bacterium]
MRQQFIASLPYALTGAQGRVIEEIAADLAHEKPMSRMLQGDVGAGKTVVAAAALVTAVAAGAQGALMAPTEILAEQHYRGLSQLLEPLGITAVLLTEARAQATNAPLTKRWQRPKHGGHRHARPHPARCGFCQFGADHCG